ncbi:MAG: hypothetical protein RI560_13810, partial [Natronomonas sp.]|nr:hypothetical protein [Natronomonas sp.]
MADDEYEIPDSVYEADPRARSQLTDEQNAIRDAASDRGGDRGDSFTERVRDGDTSGTGPFVDDGPDFDPRPPSRVDRSPDDDRDQTTPGSRSSSGGGGPEPEPAP